MRREIVWALLLAPFVRIFLIDVVLLLRKQIRRHRGANPHP